MNFLYGLLLAGVAFVVIRTLLTARPGLEPEQAKAPLKSGDAVLIDVRESGEWAGGVARDAVLLSLSDLRGPRTQWGPFLKKYRDKQLLLYCHSGARSGLAARTLTKEGFNAVNTGGLGRWQASGWPVGAARRV